MKGEINDGRTIKESLMNDVRLECWFTIGIWTGWRKGQNVLGNTKPWDQDCVKAQTEDPCLAEIDSVYQEINRRDIWINRKKPDWWREGEIQQLDEKLEHHSTLKDK